MTTTSYSSWDMRSRSSSIFGERPSAFHCRMRSDFFFSFGVLSAVSVKVPPCCFWVSLGSWFFTQAGQDHVRAPLTTAVASSCERSVWFLWKSDLQIAHVTGLKSLRMAYLHFPHFLGPCGVASGFPSPVSPVSTWLESWVMLVDWAVGAKVVGFSEW